ncbi:hypothetical protein [Novosphingobium sp. FKTRR1]|uniref:hypothetical protein n=1 Tax=Novosphingobium sp. FKTRR1 TaxID=2879118 RepID=UPI001CF09C6E|nr:hypothetical protein [Novosphingobium sp. FKTRR1]
MSVLSIMQPRQSEPMNRPAATGSDLDVVKSKGWLDSAGSAANTTVDEVPVVQQQRITGAYAPVVAEMARAQGKWAYFAYADPVKAAWALLPGANPDIKDYDALWQDMDAMAKAGTLPDALKPIYAQGRDAFESGVLSRQGAHQRDQIIAATGPASARLAGGLLGGFADPTMTGLAIATGGASRGLSVGRAILIEGLTNAGIAAVTMPANIEARARLGEDTSFGDGAAQIGTAFLFGAAAGTLTRGVGAGMRAGQRAFGSVDGANPWAVAKAFAKAVPEELRTPDQAAALHVIGRDEEVMGQSPFEPGATGDDAHAARINAAQRTVAGSISGDADAAAAYEAAVRRVESGGNPNAQAATSSASGVFGFTNGTWIAMYRKEFPRSTLPDAAVLELKGDAAVQSRLFKRLTRDNIGVLERQGLPSDQGNLYVMHHLGAGDGPKVLHADPATPLDQILSPAVIAANPHMRGMTAGEFVSWARRRVGGQANAVVAAGEDDAVAAISHEMAVLDAEQATLNARAQQGEPDSALVPDGPPAPVEAPPLNKADLDRAARTADPATLRDYDALKIRRELDRDLLERIGAERTNLPQAQELRDRIATILGKVNNVESRLTKAQVARLEEAQSSLNSLLTSDTPYMQMVRQRLLANDIKMRDLAPKVSEAYRRAVDMAPVVLPERPAAPPLRRDLFASEEARHAAQAQVNAEARARAARGAGDGQAAPEAPQAGGQPQADRVTAPPPSDAGRPASSAAKSTVPMTAPELAQPVPMPDAVAQRFADPAAADAAAQGHSMTHDVQAAVDAGHYPGVVFDTGEVETAAQALARLDDDDTALATLRGCL